MDLPQRKQNRIENYDYNQNGAYFITICVQDRKQILSEIVGDDALIVPKAYGKIVEKYIRNIPEIEKYVIMPDHIHMIIRLDNGTMWASSPTDMVDNARGSSYSHPPVKSHTRPNNRVASIVRSIKILTTKEVGKRIFQRSYYDHVIRNQHDYNEVWEYIENNPLKWAIQKQGRG